MASQIGDVKDQLTEVPPLLLRYHVAGGHHNVSGGMGRSQPALGLADGDKSVGGNDQGKPARVASIECTRSSSLESRPGPSAVLESGSRPHIPSAQRRT